MGEIQQQLPPNVTPPPGNPRFPLFDGLRGLAVLGIVVFHASEFSGRLGLGFGGRAAEVAGSQAVLTFFAISGFVLYRPYVLARVRRRPATPLGTYARRRLLRIVPGYWVALTLLAIYPGLPGVFSGDWWRYYGFLQVYSGRTENLGLGVAWTLCVEVSFYVALPLWAALMARVGGARSALAIEAPALVALIGGGLAVQLASGLGRVSYQLAVSLPGEIAWMGIGMLAAALSVEQQRRDLRLRVAPELCWLVAAGCYAALMALVPGGGLLGLIFVLESHPPTTISWHIVAVQCEHLGLQVLLTAALLAPAAFPVARRSLAGLVLGWRPLAALGVVSFSFYLWHLPIIELIVSGARAPGLTHPGWDLLAHVHSARTVALVLVAMAATAVVATISYRLVELPFMTLADPRRRGRPHMLRRR